VVWHGFVRCVFARMHKTVSINGGAVAGREEDGQNRAVLQQAISGAAELIEGTDDGEIESRVETLNGEMAYIECMRRTLVRGISLPREKLLRIKLAEVTLTRQETVKQVQTLARRGLVEITNRFDAIDQRMDDVLAMVRDPPPAVSWQRAQRDWLFRTNHAWTSGVHRLGECIEQFRCFSVEGGGAHLYVPGAPVHVIQGMEYRATQAATRADHW
jgi:hypothetical protein